MSSIDVAGLAKRYGDVLAVDRIDLFIASGSRTAIVGPSGSGKTTLLRLIAGFETPDAGRVALGDRIVVDEGVSVPAHLRRIGVVSQDGALFPHLSVVDNIGFGLSPRAPETAPRIAELMAMVDLDPALRQRRPHELSGGQQQRVALARALARRPDLMLLDEPFSALDSGLRESTRKAVEAVLSAAGVTAILVTHDQGEALSFADQVAVMRRGRLVQVGSPRDLYLHPIDPETAAFLGDAIVLAARIEAGFAVCALGRVPVDAADAAGSGRIMLRPEQVQLSPADDRGGEGPEAVVSALDYGGAHCVVTLDLDGSPPLVVRVTGAAPPEPGTRVRFDVVGRAHVFASEG